MSYQRQPYGWIAVCDTCHEFGPIGDRHFRVMRGSEDAPIHLCADCRRSAVWCNSHQQYHLTQSSHRRPCSECNGLFTSIVADQIEHCPSCRRVHMPPTPESRSPQRVAAPRTLLNTVSAWLTHALD